MFTEMNNFNYDPFVDNGSSSSVKLPPLNLYWTHQDQSMLDDDVFVTDFTDLVSASDQQNSNMVMAIKEEQQQRNQGDFFTDLNPSPLYSSSDSGFYYSSSCSYSSTSSDRWTVSSPGSCSSSLVQSPSSASSQYHQEQAFQFPPDADWLAEQQCHNQQQMQQFALQQQPEDDLVTLDDEDDEEDELRILHCRWIDCKCSFNSQENLVQHIERSHVDQRRAEDFTCFWAGCPRRHRPFNARYKLLIHMRVHSGEKPNRCSYDGCTKAFSRLENLKIHLRSHTGEKPYLCQYPTCRKTFSNSSDRAKHQRTHIDTKPYACQVPGCLKRYTDPSSLRKHVKNHVNKQYDSSEVKPMRTNSTPSVKSARVTPRRILSHCEEDCYQSKPSSFDESQSLWNNQGSIDFINMNQTEQQVIDESILLEDESILLSEMNRYVQDENDGWMFPTGDDMERLCGLSFV